MIYFIRLSADGPIRIGTSEVMTRRMEQHSKGLGKPVGVLGVMPGGQPQEVELHRRFRHLRIGGKRTEWFQPDKTLVDFIEENASAWDGSNDREIGGDSVPIACLNRSPDFAQWFKRLLQHVRLNGSTAIEHGLIALAKETGFKEPPPER